MASRTTLKLNSGYDLPIFGYGTFQSKNPEQLKTALKAAIKAGYRHIDTARIYANEVVIGETLHELYDEGIVKREDIFITTKLHMSDARRNLVVGALKKQLEYLKTTYVDLYLIHFPVALQPGGPGDSYPRTPDGKVLSDPETRIEETWAGMEECAKIGLARSIGVSNFNIGQLERIMRSGSIPPAVNQIESHPCFQNTKNITFCQTNGIQVMAYSQFGSPGTIVPFTGKPLIEVNLLEDERLIKIGAKYGKNSAQVILRWQIQRNVIVIPKSTTPSRIVDNFNIWDFQLSDEDMAEIASMDKNTRYVWLNYPGIPEHPDYPHFDSGSC